MDDVLALLTLAARAGKTNAARAWGDDHMRVSELQVHTRALLRVPIRMLPAPLAKRALGEGIVQHRVIFGLFPIACNG